MPDAHKNFAYSTIATAPTPALTGTSLVVQSGQGALFPTPPFNATVWPAGAQPTTENSEIVRVTAISTDTFTIVRNQEDSISEPIAVGDQIAATITAKVMFDAENPIVTWSPFILGSGAHSGVQTINSTSQVGSGSLLMFPITVPQNLQFNQIIVPNSLSYVTGAGAATVQVTHVSKFGLYTMNNSSVFSLITSNSFSIGETIQSASVTWNFPTTTETKGYGYGGFPMGPTTASAQLVSMVSNTRAIGLQFNRNMYVGEGRYWLGLLGYKSDTLGTNTFGLSNVGIIGAVMNPINMGGNSSGLLPFGLAGSQWTGTNNSHFSQWRGRHIAGFFTATSVANFLGTAIPSSFDLSRIGATAANLSVTILPSVTFVST